MDSAPNLNGRNAELQRLLASLQGQTDNAQAQQSAPQQYQYSNSFIGGGVELPSAVLGIPALSQIEQAGQAQLRGGSVSTRDPRSRAEKPVNNDTIQPRMSTPVGQPIPDASTITTWPAAVKHVTKHIVPDEQLGSRIKRLIQEQRKHEEQWWQQREAIVAQQKARAAGHQANVSDILQGLGGLAVPITKVDEAADRNELEIFDKKVYGALMQLVRDYDGQLRKLGVPFYAIKYDLVLNKKSNSSATITGKLDKRELSDLQKKMLQILEDLLMDG